LRALVLGDIAARRRVTVDVFGAMTDEARTGPDCGWRPTIGVGLFAAQSGTSDGGVSDPRD
jgi:hypothetical protein